jgi:enoyl-CoA hydratase/carnithine racemase
VTYRFERLAASVQDGILDVVLNRPEQRNAISHLMMAEIDRALGARRPSTGRTS